MTDSQTIPDDMAARVARLINEAEDMRQQAADDLKQIYADLREELRGLGWDGKHVSAEVAALKGAIGEMRLDEKAKEKREEKGERVDDYGSLLTRARAREGNTHAASRRSDAGLNIVTKHTEITASPETAEGEAVGHASDLLTNSPKGESNEVATGSALRAGLADPTSNTGEGAASALPAKQKVSFRPNCQHPENCASGTRDHCWSCRRAMQKSEEMA